MFNPPRRPHQGRLGFTLVELLVVIGIIALLISILLPTLNSARSSAQNVACLSNLRQVGTGLLLYTESSKGNTLPYGYTDGAQDGINNIIPGEQTAWTLLTLAYLDESGADNYAAASAGADVLTRQAFNCPTAPRRSMALASTRSTRG